MLEGGHLQEEGQLLAGEGYLRFREAFLRCRVSTVESSRTEGPELAGE